MEIFSFKWKSEKYQHCQGQLLLKLGWVCALAQFHSFFSLLNSCLQTRAYSVVDYQFSCLHAAASSTRVDSSSFAQPRCLWAPAPMCETNMEPLGPGFSLAPWPLWPFVDMNQYMENLSLCACLSLSLFVTVPIK